MKNKIINCKAISDRIREKLKDILKTENTKPCLAVILVGNDNASKTYVKNKEKACGYIGIKSEVFSLEEDVSENELVNLIDKLNNNKEVNGILVQLPLPKHINKERIIRRIDINKDVDCFHPYNVGLMDKEDSLFIPCTALGIISILNYCNIDIQGKNCVILGRSNIVGKPVANLMLKENATVTICHSKTKNLKEICQNADILISAIGKPKFIKKDMIKENSIIIDVGINRDENNNLCGDVDIDDVIEKVSLITPVPSGVGLLTVSALMRNTLIAFYHQNNKK